MNIYHADDDVVDDVSRYLADGLASDDAVVVIATSAHCDAFARRLAEHGVDLRAARGTGRYRALDAAETLAKFMIDGALHRDRFVEVIGGVITAASSGRRRVRAFGEMVALLWAADDVATAIELEAMWNDLLASHEFSLYCAYPVDILTTATDLVSVQQVCAQHSSVVAPKTYGSADPGVEAAPSRNEVVRDLESTELYVPVPSAVRAARQFVNDRLKAWGRDAIIDNASLVVSELATNAIIHAASPFRVSISRTHAAVEIAVEDLSPDRPVLDRARQAAGGKGLLVVDALCSRWGVDAGPHGKSVWAEISSSDRGRSDAA
ncbi:hypothetical protein AU186_19485 [Mycobacterium sp. GA-1999]|nr:hypothetical protein AU185_02990 [Mycobacterium sp. GA-0227b]KUH91088.1 hypothetical protein AU186_19485 [Mycobacterium sp. GA-1999]KUH95441.1 hypothetical protein AU187_10840 [Mycobacterium sp. IS-1556]